MVSAPSPRVSVIVPVYNDPARLRACLAALNDQSYPPDRFEVVVVDNGSSPPVRTWLTDSERIRGFSESLPGSYAARNRGISNARGEIVAFCDADCLPHPDWIEMGVARLTDDTGAHLVGGKIEIFPRDRLRPTAVELYEMVTYLRQREYVERRGFAATANLFAFRSVFEEVGRFDEIAKSSGDVEWCQRAVARGFRLVYADRARVRHPAQSSLRGLMRRVARLVGGARDIHRRRAVRWEDDRTAIDHLVPLPYALGLMRHPVLRTPREKLSVAAVAFALRYYEIYEGLRLTLGGVSRR
jgi:glycosyltransferase involved in cell wall biosynthesis